MTEATGVDADRTRALTGFASALHPDDVPADVREVVRACLLDTLAVCVQAAAADGGPAPLQAELDPYTGTGGGCTVIGRPGGFPADTAALWNGVAAHWFDFDDTNYAGLLHPGTSVVPAVLALAEHRDVDGARVLGALVVGYEVGARVGSALGDTTYDRGFHITSVAGVIGAAAAAAHLLRLDAAATASAIGLAASQAAGSMQYLESGALNKRFHGGFAARAAVGSAVLAGSGVTGADAAIDGRWGLLHGYSNAPDPARLTEGLGAEWLSVHTRIKPYPSCRFTHAAVDAALAHRAAFDRAADAPVDVQLSARGFGIVGADEPRKRRPRTAVDAQFSVYFQVAAALHRGGVDLGVYDRLDDPELLRTADRVRVRASDELDGLAAVVTWLDRAVRFDVPGGDASVGGLRAAATAKWHRLVDTVLGAAGSDSLVESIGRLERLGSVRPVLRALRGNGNTT